jgi:predicted Zn-dependent peptidase
VGSRNEEWGKTGLSHMLEHMMFIRNQKDWSRRIFPDHSGERRE